MELSITHSGSPFSVDTLGREGRKCQHDAMYNNDSLFDSFAAANPHEAVNLQKIAASGPRTAPPQFGYYNRDMPEEEVEDITDEDIQEGGPRWAFGAPSAAEPAVEINRGVDDATMWQKISAIQWTDIDERRMTPYVIRSRLPAQHLVAVKRFVLEKINLLKRSFDGNYPDSPILSLSPEDQTQYWSHVIARGKDTFELTMQDPSILSYMVDTYQPFLSMLSRV